MNFLSRLVVSSTLLIAVSQLSFAVQPAGQIASNPSRVNPTDPIERGGAINGVNLPKKTMVVDGVSYAFAATPVKIHPRR
ncbi:hypothetical protein LP414_26200 [Polaromonas sp. P1(28)-13]|nr:hypothetical protein LP414_26200 [Polaromonas sp. P1(28)-13]